jgi:hypothetical protein
MRSVIFTLIVLFACPAFANDGLYNGLVQSGYTYQDGLWYQGQQAFIRSQKSFTFFDGHRQCLTTRYVFEPAPQALVGEPIEGWRKELLELKASRDKWEAEIKFSQEEQKEFLETIQALGLGDYYGTDTSYPSPLNQGSHSLQQQSGRGYSQRDLHGTSMTYRAPLAAQGNTLFGYDQYVQSYPDVDLQLLYNQANNLAKQAQGLSSDATADFSALVYQEGRRQEEIAKIIARGRVAAQVLQLLQDPQQAELKIDEWRLRRNTGSGDWEVVPKQPDAAPEPEGEIDLSAEQKQELFGIITNRCVACHGPEVKKAGLDMTKFLALDKIKRQGIVKTLTHADPDERMPKATGGVPGEPLPMAEIDLFYRAAGLAREE